jgi:hypothetical protein
LMSLFLKHPLANPIEVANPLSAKYIQDSTSGLRFSVCQTVN